MTKKLKTNKLLMGLAVLAFAVMAAPSARGDEQQVGVARISVIQGDVSTQRGDSGDWGAATVNTPVVTGDRISTGTHSRAELQLDYASILRMDERANVKIAELSRTRVQLQVQEGLINYSVLKGSEADVEIDTSNVAIRPMGGEGSYRIFVLEDQTRVIVRKGELEVTTPQGSTRVKKNQEIDIRGQDAPEYQVVDAPGHDDWDNWNKDRDRQIQNAESWRHTNRYYSGTEDLDHNGRWANVPGYGDVWQPAVSSDWAPYRDGRWVWEPYYGWTWVSYESWGWAPYHYGRWFVYGNSWSWWPGPVYSSYYPEWAPAYVSFFGFGRHFGVGVGFGFGSVGWLPIGPSDCYYPWWGGHRREFNVVNVTNITNITNITNVNNGLGPVAPLATGRPVMSNLNGVTTNAHLQRGITAMPTEKFGHTPVGHNIVTVSAADIRQGGLVAGNLPVVPTKESLRASDRTANPSTMPKQAVRPEHFFTKTQPTFTPQPFHEQAAQVAQAIQQHQTTNQTPNTAGSTPSVHTATDHAAVSHNSEGRPITSQPAAIPTPSATSKPVSPAPAPATSADRQNWHRFGAATTAPNEHAAPQRQDQPRMQSPGQPATQYPAARPNTPPTAQTPAARPSTPPTTQTPAAPRTNPQPATSSSGWQKFSGPPRTSVPESRAPQQQREISRPSNSTPAPVPAPRPASPPQSSTWHGFTPQQDSGQSTTARPAVVERGQSRNGQTYSNSSAATSGPAARSDYRPPLDLHRSIVTPRPDSNYGGSRGSSSGGGASYGGGRSSAPSGGSYGGARSSTPSGGSYGGAPSSAPSGGSYGGGRSSAPSGGSYGGGRSSAPSGNARGSSSGGNSGGSSHPPHGSGSRGPG